jgi:hypothetical protein
MRAPLEAGHPLEVLGLLVLDLRASHGPAGQALCRRSGPVTRSSPIPARLPRPPASPHQRGFIVEDAVAVIAPAGRAGKCRSYTAERQRRPMEGQAARCGGIAARAMGQTARPARRPRAHAPGLDLVFLVFAHRCCWRGPAAGQGPEVCVVVFPSTNSSTEQRPTRGRNRHITTSSAQPAATTRAGTSQPPPHRPRTPAKRGWGLAAAKATEGVLRTPSGGVLGGTGTCQAAQAPAPAGQHGGADGAPLLRAPALCPTSRASRAMHPDRTATAAGRAAAAKGPRARLPPKVPGPELCLARPWPPCARRPCSASAWVAASLPAQAAGRQDRAPLGGVAQKKSLGAVLSSTGARSSVTVPAPPRPPRRSPPARPRRPSPQRPPAAPFAAPF